MRSRVKRRHAARYVLEPSPLQPEQCLPTAACVHAPAKAVKDSIAALDIVPAKELLDAEHIKSACLMAPAVATPAKAWAHHQSVMYKKIVCSSIGLTVLVCADDGRSC